MPEIIFADDLELAGEVALSDEGRDTLRQRRIQMVVFAALDGSLAQKVGLQEGDRKKLSARDVALCAEKSLGAMNTELAEKYDLAQETVGVVLRHPFSRAICAAIATMHAERAADPIERIQSFAHEMIDTKLEIVRNDGADLKLRNDIASDFLDRAGYGAKRQVDAEVRHSFTVPKELARRLVDGLDESKRVGDVSYAGFLQRGAGLQQEGEPAGADPASGVGRTEGSLESSLEIPAASPATERVA